MYIPPENSRFHQLYDIDIFKILEMDITEYSNKGQIVVAGDLNSRTGNRPDYIENDFSLFNNDNDLDTPLPRYSEDKTTNRFGHYLLDLCKAVQLRIVNGRLFDDSCIGAYTCMTPTGSSSIDLVNGNMEGYKILRNKVTAMIDIAKKETYQCKIEEGKNDPRSIWKIFNDI